MNCGVTSYAGGPHRNEISWDQNTSVMGLDRVLLVGGTIVFRGF